MAFPFSKIDYAKLNSRQKENYNYHKISAILADYGFTTLRLSDDREGADFIAKHLSGQYLLVQQKTRMAFAKKYLGKNLYIACPRPEGGCYLYPHDDLPKKVTDATDMATQDSWTLKGGYSFPWSWLTPDLKKLLAVYKIEAVTATPLPEDD